MSQVKFAIKGRMSMLLLSLAFICLFPTSYAFIGTRNRLHSCSNNMNIAQRSMRNTDAYALRTDDAEVTYALHHTSMPTGLGKPTLSTTYALSRSSRTLGMGPLFGYRPKWAPLDGNYPRKMKRIMRSVKNETDFAARLCTPRFERFLVNETTFDMYETMMSKLNKTARCLGFKLNPAFAMRSRPVPPTIAETLATLNGTSVFYDIVKAMSLTDLLTTTSNITVFAPIDTAFAKYEPDPVTTFLSDEALKASVRTYITTGHWKPKRLAGKNGDKIATLVEDKALAVKVMKTDGSVTVGGAGLVNATGIKCSNGLIYTIKSFCS